VRRLLFVLLSPLPAFALSPAAQEFMEISAQLEPVQCEKRQLRRQIVLAQVERREEDAKKLRARARVINRGKQTTRLEKRLAELQSRILDGKGSTHDPEDLQAISFQQRQAFYRCE
jgi:hypothetical protein